ncbi:hypothetical protein LTR84_008824 [Exophiala bonariae]|uniref:Glucose-methanol-choline oxidoreductase N-terminal domain-containing protein n=1 Tax=Exophiala bonariae TaxID=1690606 RepID=A0AAV9MZG7_9EURO|nr:hypothetical protein LTR84_008824 [Exophiala bonariae]
MTENVCTVNEFVQNTYDYIICGGGTAGSVLAARLSELPDVTVGLVEAGGNSLGDPNVLTPLLFPALLTTTQYDWMYTTSAQHGTRDMKHSFPRGKTLGGSSATNFMVYVRGHQSDYNDWAAFNAPDWSFSKLLPFFKKSQQLDAPPANDENAKAIIPLYHGTTGPIHTSFNSWRFPIEDDVIEAFHTITGRTARPRDAWSGEHIGIFPTLSVIDRTQRKGTRSYSGSAYLAPSLTRPNLKVLCNATVSKVILDHNVAIGVKVTHEGQEYDIRAGKEVIVSAGAIGSPQLLELSGIGDPDILQAAGVECLIANPEVGANFQDHVISAICVELNQGHSSMDSLPTSPEVLEFQKQYMATKDGPLSCGPSCMGFLPLKSLVSGDELQETIEQIKNTKGRTDFHKKQLAQVIDQLQSPTSANVQFMLIPGRMNFKEGVGDQSKLFGKVLPEDHDNVSIAVALQYPASRGSVHITSSDPLKQPQIDPGYLSHPADAKALAAGVAFAMKLSDSLVENGKVARRTLPITGHRVSSTSLRDFVRENCVGEYHAQGTCSISQVVDARLRVKRAERLRVIDASVFPNNLSGNILASVYAAAEKGAELVKEDMRRAPSDVRWQL